MDYGFTDRVGLVTGSSVGIGRGIAELLGSEGLQLALVARRQELLEEVSATIQEAGGKAPLLLPYDLTDPETPARIRDSVLERFGRLDILVHNAGKSNYWFRKPIKAPDEWGNPFDIPEDTWDASFAINFTPIRRITDAFLPAMIESNYGRIVLISGKWEPDHMSVGLAAKAAAAVWAKGISREIAKYGITINVVPVGRVNSEQLLGKILPTEEARAQVIRTIPAQRLGDAVDVASTVAFLVSEGSGYITGQNLTVDGGLSKFAF